MAALPFAHSTLGENNIEGKKRKATTNKKFWNSDFWTGFALFRFTTFLSLLFITLQLKLMNQIPLYLIKLGDEEAAPNQRNKYSSLAHSDGKSYKETIRRRYNDCPFQNSSIVESIYVYPHPGSPEWKGDILSDYVRHRVNSSSNVTIEEYPWITNDLHSKTSGTGPYDYNSQLVQYNTELLVRDIIIHPDSCLRTYDPDKAKLFYIPYLPAAEFHNGSLFPEKTRSKYGKAIQDIITEKKYDAWEKVFGLTSKYWKKRGGSDHILVFSEPMHGLWHPSSRRGNFHFLHSQFQTHAPVVISNELSKTFINMYPMCAKKNILMPYPNTDGRWFNGKLDDQVKTIVAERTKIRKLSDSFATIKGELELEGQREQNQKEQEKMASNTTASPLRILGYYYTGGNHGTCKQLRSHMKHEFQCSPSGKFVNKYKKVIGHYSHGYRQASFCPCPGGDSPSAKRNFDVILSGCIPVILSEDFVWPFTAEFDRRNDNQTGGSDGVNMAFLNPDDFSIRLRARDHDKSLFDSPETCNSLKNDNSAGWQGNSTLQSVLEAIPSDELARLRRGLSFAADAYSYYKKSSDLPDNPLQKGILPEGGAAHTLVKALEERASGALWDACRREMEDKDIKDDKVLKFKC